MKGWAIFLHSVRLVFNNLGDAFRVSAVLYLVQVAGQVASFGDPVVAPGQVPDPGVVMRQFLFGAAGIVASLWIAVAWHRFVLEEEYPTGWLPRWQGGYMLAYLGRSVILGLIVVIALIGAAIPVAIVGAVAPGATVIFGLGLIGLGAYLFFRLGPMLPAAAVGRRMTVREAWASTRDGADGAIVVLAILVIAGSLLLQGPAMMNPDPASVVNLLYAIVTGWFATIIGISILTTLYGHYVEGRSID